jgi:ABC-2 type transport system permease protein
MSTTSTALNVAASSTFTPAQRINTYRLETKYEFLKLLRTRSFSLSIIGFPVMFYLLFGVANKHSFDGGFHIAKYMLGGYACFGLIGAALFGIGVGLSSELAAGWLELKRSSPMPVASYLLAKCLSAVAFGIIIVGLLTLIGVTLGGVVLTSTELVKMLGMTIVGSLAFASMGLFLAMIVPANAAPGVANLIYLPMSFLGGLWIPLQYLPHWLQLVAPFMPTYHLAQLMLSVYGYQQQGSSMMIHWNALAGFTMLMLGLSWMVFHRKERSA